MPDMYTHRGFRIYAEFTDTYGSTIRVQKSSSATRDAVWVFCDGAADTPDLTSPHMDVRQAKRLRDALDEFIKAHPGE